MKQLKKELRNNEGRIDLVPESLDDLWHLKHIIEPADLVTAVTPRRVESATDKIRPEKVERKPVRLSIRVEEVEFHRFSNWLRAHGVIEEGMDTGSHHTVNIEPGLKISISKSWKKDQLDRIKEAVKASDMPSVIIATIEEGACVVGVLRQYGVEELFGIKQSGSKEEGTRKVFFQELLEALKSPAERVQFIILAGPGFAKDDFLSFVRESASEIADKIVIETTTSIGSSGFQEVLRRGAVERVTQELNIAKEARLIEELMAEISKDGPAAYGYDEVNSALQYGAIKTLMVADETLRSMRDEDVDIDALMDGVEQKQGDITVFSSEFEPGQRLLSLGGIAALLRFPIK